MPRQVFFDGLNLALEKGTGIATYTRYLLRANSNLQHQTGILYSGRRAPSVSQAMREIDFFDNPNVFHGSEAKKRATYVYDNLKNGFSARPTELKFGGVVFSGETKLRVPHADKYYVARNVFGYANWRFKTTGSLTPIHFDTPPDIMHLTYQLPLYVPRAANVWTIHDLVPLRLPHTTLDDKASMYRLLKYIARKADHIVTVSENSRRDIISLLGVEERRVSNTYQCVEFDKSDLERTDSGVAEELSGSFGLDFGGYLLFFGALEPKKNVARLLDAYLASGVEIPLVLVMGQGWSNEKENRILSDHHMREMEAAGRKVSLRRRFVRFEYVSRSMLTTLVRGARAVLFPSLYEGFGLPVLEAMSLGTPVLTSNTSSLPEVAGSAALTVDPYDMHSIAKGIRALASDCALCAELSQRGRKQAELFSMQRYQERLKNVYDKL